MPSADPANSLSQTTSHSSSIPFQDPSEAEKAIYIVLDQLEEIGFVKTIKGDTSCFRMGSCFIELMPRGIKLSYCCFEKLNELGFSIQLIQAGLSLYELFDANNLSVVEFGSKSIQVLSKSGYFLRIAQMPELKNLHNLNLTEMISHIERYLSFRKKIIEETGILDAILCSEHTSEPMTLIPIETAIENIQANNLNNRKRYTIKKRFGTAAFREIKAALNRINQSELDDFTQQKIKEIELLLSIINPISSRTEAKLTRLSMDLKGIDPDAILSPGSTSQDIILPNDKAIEIKLPAPIGGLIDEELFTQAKQAIQQLPKDSKVIAIAANSTIKKELKALGVLSEEDSNNLNSIALKPLLLTRLDGVVFLKQCPTLYIISHIFSQIDNGQLNFVFRAGSTKSGFGRLTQKVLEHNQKVGDKPVSVSK